MATQIMYDAEDELPYNLEVSGCLPVYVGKNCGLAYIISWVGVLQCGWIERAANAGEDGQRQPLYLGKAHRPLLLGRGREKGD